MPPSWLDMVRDMHQDYILPARVIA
jgi:hypothetical protein